MTDACSESTDTKADASTTSSNDVGECEESAATEAVASNGDDVYIEVNAESDDELEL